MEPNSEIEPEDFMEIREPVNKLPGINRRKRFKKAYSPDFKWQYIAIIVVLIIIMAFLFFKNGKGVSEEQIVSLGEAIENLKNRINDLDSRFNQLTQSFTSLEKKGGTDSQRLSKLNNQFSQMEKKVNSLSVKLEELSRSKNAPAPVPEIKTGYYEVQRGDTLYGIATRHNLSVEKLLSLNNLKKNQNIYPGQKLKVTN